MTRTQMQPPNEAFDRDWRATFGETPPVGYMLRTDFHDGWCRFHALPGSKRYAETDAERDTICARANSLALACLGDGADTWLIMPHYGPDDIAGNDIADELNLSPVLSWFDDVEEIELHFSGRRMRWVPGAMDRLITEIAQDNARAVFFSTETRSALAPYDGGFDIINAKPERVKSLEAKFASWMSARQDRM